MGILHNTPNYVYSVPAELHRGKQTYTRRVVHLRVLTELDQKFRKSAGTACNEDNYINSFSSPVHMNFKQGFLFTPYQRQGFVCMFYPPQRTGPQCTVGHCEKYPLWHLKPDDVKNATNSQAVNSVSRTRPIGR